MGACRGHIQRVNQLNRWMILVAALCFYCNLHAEEWFYLDNGEVRLGVIKDSGAGIGWFSKSGSDRNLLNHFDRGRLVQQSYYGNKDGSKWNGQEWRWNPVQGGEWKGKGSQLLAFETTSTNLYAKLHPRNWGGGELLTNVVMEEWISLTGKLAKVRFKFNYSGKENHQEIHHEIPAFFTEPDLSTLVIYDGKMPWENMTLSRSQPSWPNESRRMTESWAAYVDKLDFGVGVYVPIAKELTCYRYGDGRTSAQGACSYFAPLTRFAISPGLGCD